MDNKKQFMVVQDETIANKLKLAGFLLVSDSNNTYTFINSVPKNFNFEEVDVAKIAYTNMLSI